MAQETASTLPSVPSFSTLTPGDHPDHPYSVWPSSSPTSPSNPLGRLVLLTPAVVKLALQEVQTGERVSLDLPISEEYQPLGRKACRREVIRIDGGPATKQEADEKGEVWNPVHDDVLHINTQSYPGSGLFYHGATSEDVLSGQTNDGYAAIAEAGGILGRGVLVDYARWAAKNGIAYDPCLESHSIPLAVVQQIANEAKIEFRVGDILVLRTGFETRHNELVAAGQRSRIVGKYVGLDQGEATLRWLWETGFSAVVGDHPAFECWPPPPGQLPLHSVLLSGWGLPIGELFSLDKLATALARHERSTFLFTAVPLKVVKGIASTGNAIAIL
ncbi:hypothetical protein JCM8097_009067 [Rhodosporidiobolus ruineniae]